MGYLEKKRNAMMNSISAEQPPLPSEYQEVEYIQSTGTQYLNTQLLFNADMSIDAKTSSNGNSNNATVFGAVTSGDSSIVLTLSNSQAYMRFFTTGGTLIWSTYSPSPNHILTLQAYRNYTDIDVDGTQTTSTYSTTGNNVTIPIYLFARNIQNVPTGLAELKMYYFKVFDEYGNIALDLIPCYRKSDNEIGMYDVINDVFYTNQGTGTFLKGGDV